MKTLIFALLAALSFTGCSTHRRSPDSPVFLAPSAAPVRASVAKVKEHVVKAAEQAKVVAADIDKVSEAIVRLEARVTGLPGFRAEDAAETGPVFEEVRLRLDAAILDSAGISANFVVVLDELNLANTHIGDLEAAAVAQAEVLSEFSTRSARLTVENAQITDDRDRWRKTTLQWRFRTFLLLFALAIYLARGPILFGARKLIGLP